MKPDDYDLSEISGRLKWARETVVRLSQPELAARAGVAQGTIGNIESGARKNPRELLAIARAAGVHAEWLKTGKGPRELADSAAEAIEGRTELALAPPPVPPADFRDRREVSDSDWGILEDVKLVLDKDELARIHERAEMLRQHARDWWESNIAAPAAAKTAAAPGEAKVPSPLRPSQAKLPVAKKGAAR